MLAHPLGRRHHLEILVRRPVEASVVVEGSANLKYYVHL
jgi:hypothetical protein